MYFEVNPAGCIVTLRGKGNQNVEKTIEELLTADAYTQLHKVLLDYCLKNTDEDRELNRFHYNIIFNEEDNTIRFSVESTINADSPEEKDLEGCLDYKVINKIISKHEPGTDDEAYEGAYNLSVNDLSLEDGAEEGINKKLSLKKWDGAKREWIAVENKDIKKQLFLYLRGVLRQGDRNRIRIENGRVKNVYSYIKTIDEDDVFDEYNDGVMYEIKDDKLQGL